MTHYFITAIGTDSGKTVVSAIFCQALGYDYWKPIQSGSPTDTDSVKSLVTNPKVNFHEELYLFELPASPHLAAANEQHEIYLNLIKTNFNTLSSPTILEGAGGILVPLNDEHVIADIPQLLNVPVIVVANLYLGSINHTLLTIEELKRRNIEIAGIVFNGEDPQGTKDIMISKTGLRELLHVEKEEKIDQSTIEKYANELRSKLD